MTTPDCRIECEECGAVIDVAAEAMIAAENPMVQWHPGVGRMVIECPACGSLGPQRNAEAAQRAAEIGHDD